MKVVILAGGFGTRLSEETEVRPKPMVEIGGRPILWHIMKHYSHHGFNEFVLALGYREDVVKRFFLDYQDLSGSLTISLRERKVEVHDNHPEDWRIDLVDTGLETQTGGRLRRLRRFVGGGTFMMTYGDGVSDVDLRDLLGFHKSHGRLATLTAVRPPARYGALKFEGDRVSEFTEKPQIGEGWVNGGFYVLEPEVLDYIGGDEVAWEYDPLAALAREGQLVAYKHPTFWQCMDTLRDKRLLDALWGQGRAPWKSWQ